MNDYRVFVLGAGFSRPAGLPLADELWNEVVRRARGRPGLSELLDRELKAYEAFRQSRGDEPSEPDFEEFMAFLDIEHALGLEGGETWSAEGNELQLGLKWLIAQVLVERTPSADQLPECYTDFADSLQPNDHILTFNYDTLLESSLDRCGKAYRLFPNRYSDVHDSYGTLDSSRDEVTITKLHGSVDWFDRSSYEYRQELQGSLPEDLVFGPTSPVTTVPLLEGPHLPDDPTAHVHRVTAGLGTVYQHAPSMVTPPLMLAPSRMKVLYADRLKYHFWGLSLIGGLNLGLVVIGYSLPRHDDYARQFLMRVFANYQEVYWDAVWIAGMKKKPALLIDFRSPGTDLSDYERAYSFSDPAKTIFHMGGFDRDAIDLIRSTT